MKKRQGMDGSFTPSQGASRRGIQRTLFVGAISAALLITAIPAVASVVRPSTSSTAKPGFHLAKGAHGALSINKCSFSTSARVAHCNVMQRIDAAAKKEHPLRRGVTASPNVIGNGGAYDPSYLQSAYNVSSMAAVHGGGAGQVVAIIDAYDDPNLVSDLAHYRSNFGVSACPAGSVSPSNSNCVVQVVNQSGAASPLPAGNTSWATETSLDVDMVSAICPNCQILVVEASSAQITDLGTAVNTAVALGANVVSNSYGSAEFAAEVNYDGAYYSHPGVPVVASSGDNGFGVQYPAASPFVTAVGGTSLTQLTNSGTRNGSESAWSGAGAGCSAYEAKPAWQTDSGCANRTVADVSAVADPATGVWVYDTYGASGLAIYGGTSVAAPIISSIYALAANPPGASTTPASYAYNSSGALYHVTSGNDGGCGTYLCDATKSVNGYNGPTGLGSPGGNPNSLNAFLANPGSATAPSAPSLSSATAGVTSVALTWSAPGSNGGSAITGYNVFVGTSAGGESLTPVNASPITSTSYAVSGLTSGTKYYFTVQAVNAVGSSPSSNELSATPASSYTIPGAPSLKTATAGSSSVALAWTAPSNNGGGITGYNVFVGTRSGRESSTPSNSSLVAGTSFTVTGLTNGTNYYFTVKAVNSAGSSTASNELSAKPANAPMIPGAVANLLAKTPTKRAGVALTWSAPSNGGSPITSYIIYRSTSSGTETAYLTLGCTSSTCSYADSATTTGTTYYYQVTATNIVGTGPKSNQSSAVAK